MSVLSEGAKYIDQAVTTLLLILLQRTGIRTSSRGALIVSCNSTHVGITTRARSAVAVFITDRAPGTFPLGITAFAAPAHTARALVVL